MIHRTSVPAGPRAGASPRVPVGAALALGLFLALPSGPVASASGAWPHRSGGSGGSDGGGDLESLIATEVAEAGEREDLWARALELRDAERLATPGELDRILDRHLGQPDTLSPEAVLLLSTARLQGGDPDAVLLALALSPVLGSRDDALAQKAAGLFGDTIFKSLRGERKDELMERLLAGARDGSRAPETRLAFARTAHAIGSGTQGRDARAEVLAFLDSSDANLRALGALALASLRGEPVEGRLRRELERLARIPDQRGELAAAYLDQASLKDLHDRRLKDLRDKHQDEDGRTPAELRELLTVLRMIENMHLEGSGVDQQELLHAAINGMLHWMDQHSSYLEPEAYARFFQELEAEYGGIGAYVDEDPDNGLFTIVRPIYSGPAYHAGLVSDDKIVRIGDWPTLGKDLDEIIKRLKGEPGTKVKLYVWRRGMDADLIERPTDEMVVEVERQRIEIPAGSHQLLPGGIGLVELDTFSDPAQRQLQQAIEAMQGDGLRALVLDLRANSGGLLTQAREVADLFLEKGKVVVSTESRGESKPEALRTRTDPVLPPDLPIVILTSRFTASAAEIVAGALQDHGRATLVGTRTYGKGSVQQLIPVEWPGAPVDDWNDVNGNGYWDTWEPITVDHDGDGEVDYAPRIKLTVARYLLPSGRSIHRQLNRESEILEEGGVMPDVVVDMPTIEIWRYRERERLRDEHTIRDYVDRLWATHHELFSQLALNDNKDEKLYPEFDALMAQCATTLPRDDVRGLVRAEIRRRVQDDRGAEFPRGDFVEDVQLQKAIEVALEQLGESYEQFAEFTHVFDYERTESPDPAGLVTGAEED